LRRDSRYKLRMGDDLAALVRGLHPALKNKVRGSIEAILSNPIAGKTLKDELSELRSFRVARFRIIYRVVRKEIQIVTIGPRSRIYEETLRLIKKGSPSIDDDQ
jgi:mRNA interferase RelE/StbE